ncbi:hypothetical protein SDRG_17073 [Saprolegnia diclina VS20]|uniref:Uncharacterized protein n=1 Tax=Saprolegnia diclina (strain VS20) TaxID=1156394 RepID=T0R6A7_SAPDV|nr:hypothetical protein SDRG_17073 [Saprolegnia diclina VS20]EQC25042.1 hypothetical protein SDRG_17073 [Saprolegnia diclina VS20]|eukprot:XP_008621530.1 hypothetical protein SDRG_17073 [Saprolegnia diclina VS20]
MAAAKAALDHTKAVLERIEYELNHTKTDLNTTKAASQERADACTRMCSTLKAEKDHLHMAMVQLSNDLGAAKKSIALQEQATDAYQQQIEALLCETRRLTSMVEQQEAAKSELADAATASTLLLEATIQEKTDALAATTLQLHAATTCVDTQTQQIETLLGNKTELTSVLQQLQADLDASSTALALAQDAVAASAQQNETLMAANSHLVHTNAQLTADVATAIAEAARTKASSDDVADASAKHAARVNASKARLLETIKSLQHTLATQAPMVCDQCTHWKGLLAQSSTVIGSLRTELAAALERATAPADVVRAFFERVHATFPILRYSAIEVLIDGIYGGDTRVFEATDGFQVFPHC